MDNQPEKQPEEPATNSDVPTESQPTEPQKGEETPATTEASRPNQLAALMLAASFGFYGVHQIYLGNKTQGYVRLALAILAFPLMFLLVGFLIPPVLFGWTLYDFVRIGFGNVHDAQGKPLVASERDANWARVLTIVALVLLAFYVVLVLLAISLGVFAGLNESIDSTPTYDVYEF